MTSTNTARLVVPAPANTPCGWWMYSTETGHKHTCGSDRLAVHVLTATLPVAAEGTALCGFHSPYDVTEADRAATAGTVVDPDACVKVGHTGGYNIPGVAVCRL